MHISKIHKMGNTMDQRAPASGVAKNTVMFLCIISCHTYCIMNIL